MINLPPLLQKLLLLHHFPIPITTQHPLTNPITIVEISTLHQGFEHGQSLPKFTIIIHIIVN